LLFVIVLCDKFPDLDDASFVLGQDEAEDTTESEAEEEQEVCLKMPAVATTPNKPAMPEKPLRQSTLTQAMNNFYTEPTLVLPVAAAAMPAEEQQLLPRSFMPPYFITKYPTGTVTRLVRVVINLPGGVASHDINNVAVSLDEDSAELIVQVKLHPYMTGLKFFGQLGKAVGPGGSKKYDNKHLSIFLLHLQMYQARLRPMAFDDIYYTARIPLEGYNVSHGVVMEDDWEILQSKIPGGSELALLVVTLQTPNLKQYDQVPEGCSTKKQKTFL